MYQVFISSTQNDLLETRLQVQQALLRGFKYFPVGMENFHASGQTPLEVIREQIKASDFFVLIIGGKYGSVNKKTGLSYTEEEYQYAKSLKIPILPFIRDRNVLLEIETESKPELKEKLENFINLIKRNHHFLSWKDKRDLELIIVQSLDSELDRLKESGASPVGWIRADKKISSESISETTMKFYNIHAVVKGTLNNCEKGSALLTYTGSALVDSPEKTVVYEDRVKTKFGVVSYHFFPKEQLTDEDGFKRNPIELEYKLVSENDYEPLYFTGEIVVNCQLPRIKGGLGLHIPYFAENIGFFLDFSAVPFICDYNGKAYVSRKDENKIVRRFDETNVIYNRQNMTYAITARNVPADSNIVFVWDNR